MKKNYQNCPFRSRTASQSKKITQKVEIINKNSIVKNSPATGAEVLLLAPSVRVQKSQGEVGVQ